MTDRPELQSSRRVLVVHEGKNGPTATQMISFGQPFESRGGAPAYQISFETHLPDRGGIEKAFGDHGPHVLVLSRYTSELGLEWIQPPAPIAHVLADGRVVTLERSIDDTVAQLGDVDKALHSQCADCGP